MMGGSKDLGLKIHPMQGEYDEDEELQAQKKVASVIERWESRSISADALQHMRERASAYASLRGSSADGSATDEASTPKVSLAAESHGPARHLFCTITPHRKVVPGPLTLHMEKRFSRLSHFQCVLSQLSAA